MKISKYISLTITIIIIILLHYYIINLIILTLINQSYYSKAKKILKIITKIKNKSKQSFLFFSNFKKNRSRIEIK